MKVIKLTHANLNRPVYWLPTGFWFYDEASKATVVLTTERISFPAKESPEEIARLVSQITVPEGQGEENAKQAVRRPAVNVRKRKTRKNG